VIFARSGPLFSLSSHPYFAFLTLIGFPATGYVGGTHALRHFATLLFLFGPPPSLLYRLSAVSSCERVIPHKKAVRLTSPPPESAFHLVPLSCSLLSLCLSQEGPNQRELDWQLRFSPGGLSPALPGSNLIPIRLPKRA